MALRSAIGGLASLLVGASAMAQDASAKVVLELFTSQGCSSCPPADALLEVYKKRDDIIALSVPVDYWDRLGWKDTYASRAYTLRQQEYARARGDGQVYTPQIVVDGGAHVVGSYRGAIDNAIAASKKALANSHVTLQARIEGADIVVDVGAARAGAVTAGGKLLVATVKDAGTVAIGRGENAQRSITYHNVVRSLDVVGTWSGAAQTVRVAKSSLKLADAQSVVVMLQNGAGGPILGATQVRLGG